MLFALLFLAVVVLSVAAVRGFLHRPLSLTDLRLAAVDAALDA